MTSGDGCTMAKGPCALPPMNFIASSYHSLAVPRMQSGGATTKNPKLMA